MEFCAGHARDGMVDLKSTKCAQRGCTKIPSLGVPGTRQREFCRENARDGMVDLINRNSAHRGCAKAAPRSVSGTKRRESCREHAKDGMANVRDAVVLGPETALDRDTPATMPSQARSSAQVGGSSGSASTAHLHGARLSGGGLPWSSHQPTVDHNSTASRGGFRGVKS